MRYILIDRITKLEAGRRMQGIKNVSMSDSLIVRYRPDLTALPAALVLEAMAQGAGLLLIATIEFDAQPVLAKVQYFSAFAQARPGDQIVVSAEIEDLRAEGCKAHVQAEIANSLLAEATIYLALVPLGGGRSSQTLRVQMSNLFPEWFAASAGVEAML